MVAVSADTRRVGDSVKYTYAPTGSSGGKTQLVEGKVHFAGSDSALSASEKSKMPKAWFVPSIAGAIAVGFNAPGIANEELLLTREALADVFLGRISKWSELSPWNPKLANVTRTISIIVRKDGSGTSSAFTSALSSFSAEWRASVGSSSTPKWPKADGRGEGNSGVAVKIMLTEYSMGYISIGDAKAFGVMVAKVQNSEAAFVSPASQESVQAAADAFGPKFQELSNNGSQLFFVDIVDPKGRLDAYPIATFTYLAFDEATLDCRMLLDIICLVYWAWFDEQAAKMAADQQLVPVSASVREACLSALMHVKCGVQSPLANVQRAFGNVCTPGAIYKFTRTLARAHTLPHAKMRALPRTLCVRVS
jgi:phosphate transport system substrate-binding protein